MLGFIPPDKVSQYFVGSEQPSHISTASSSSMMVDPSLFSPTVQSTSIEQALPNVQAHVENQPPSIAELVRMNPILVAHLGLDHKTLKLVDIIHKVRVMSPHEFDKIEPKQKADLINAFKIADLPLPVKHYDMI
jgi:hypothetical protein